jgi:TfoX/Sxy family transcriptional regulator of competence genes
MAYDEGLAERIRGILAEEHGLTEKRMFGGLAFMVHGHMCVGIVKDELMVRVDPELHEKELKKPHARQMDFTGRPMRGFLFVGVDGYETDADLESWVRQSLAYVSGLPAKAPAAGRGHGPSKAGRKVRGKAR